MLKILMFEISAMKGLCYVICGSEVKTSDLAAHFHTILALQIRFCLLFKPDLCQGSKKVRDPWFAESKV